VAAAAVVVFSTAVSAAGDHRTSYVVAARPLPAGSVIGVGDMTTAPLALTGATGAAAFRDGSALIGRNLAVAVAPGELIQQSMLASGGAAGQRPVSIPVDADSLAALQPGQAVDVLATPSGGSPGGTATPAVTVVMRGATLESISRADAGYLSATSGSTVVVTLGVSDLAEAEQLVQASHSGTVELVQAEPADGSGLGGGGGS
jgi:Flp pilus assembly protein CpaB